MENNKTGSEKEVEQTKKRLLNMRSCRLLGSIAGALIMSTLGSSLFAKNKNNDTPKEKAVAEMSAKVGFSDISALIVTPEKTCFYNNFVPSVEAKAKIGKVSGSFSAKELLILSNKDWSAVNSQCLFELACELGDKKGQLSLVLGRDNVDAGTHFFSGVDVPNYWLDSKGFVSFGNLSDRMTLKYKNNRGDLAELGMIGNVGNGFAVAPNPKNADLFAKIGARVVNNDNFKLQISASGQVGNTDAVMANITAKGDKLGVSVGGNYDINKQELRAFSNIAYTTSKDLTLIFNTCVTGKDMGFTISASKNGLEAFSQVNVSKDKPATASLGVSYSFGSSKSYSK